MGLKSGLRLITLDFALAYLWVASGATIKLLVFNVLEMDPRGVHGQALRYSLSVANMFLFAWLGLVTRGASYNPLTILSSAMTGKFSDFLYTVFGRIPAQVFGSVIAVRILLEIFPGVGRGPRLNVELHHGALTEGFLTFMIVITSMSLKKADPKSFFMKTWMSSIMKLSLHVLGSDLTGGCMNPASAFGWAYARGDYMTKEHMCVYWLAPLEATLFGAWVFGLLTQSLKEKEQSRTASKEIKSE